MRKFDWEKASLYFDCILTLSMYIFSAFSLIERKYDQATFELLLGYIGQNRIKEYKK